jgi:hypothetical protein
LESLNPEDNSAPESIDAASDPSQSLERPVPRECFRSRSSAEIAVDALSAEELAELAAFIRERDQAAWDRQIDEDFATGGRLTRIAEEIRTDA